MKTFIKFFHKKDRKIFVIEQKIYKILLYFFISLLFFLMKYRVFGKMWKQKVEFPPLSKKNYSSSSFFLLANKNDTDPIRVAIVDPSPAIPVFGESDP